MDAEHKQALVRMAIAYLQDADTEFKGADDGSPGSDSISCEECFELKLNLARHILDMLYSPVPKPKYSGQQARRREC